MYKFHYKVDTVKDANGVALEEGQTVQFQGEDGTNQTGYVQNVTPQGLIAVWMGPMVTIELWPDETPVFVIPN